MASGGSWKRERSGVNRRKSKVEHFSRQAENIAAISPVLARPLADLSRRHALQALVTLARPIIGLDGLSYGQDSDVMLATLSDELREVEAASKRLLADNDRDAVDIPGYVQLANRHAALVEALGSIQAGGRRGLLAKAQAVVIKDAQAGYDGAVSIAISLAADVVAVLGADKSVDWTSLTLD